MQLLGRLLSVKVPGKKRLLLGLHLTLLETKQFLDLISKLHRTYLTSKCSRIRITSKCTLDSSIQALRGRTVHIEPEKGFFHILHNFLDTSLGRTSNTILQILSVKGGGGSTPKIRNPHFAENFVRKGGRGVPPKSVTHFFFLPKSGVF